MAKKADTRTARIRNTILIFVVSVVVLVLGWGTIYSTGIVGTEFVEGEHYRLVENPPRRRPADPIVVQEFFSYGCVHCRNFDPLVVEWQATLPQGVTFKRTPAAFSPIWSLLAQTYLTLDYLGILEQNHDRLFRQIHDNRGQFLSADEIADFIAGNGTSRDEFLRAFNSPQVRRALRDADVEMRDFGIASVPTLVVAGKYVVTMDQGRKTALDIADYLITLERGGGNTVKEDSSS